MQTTSLFKNGLVIVILLLFIGNMIIPLHGQMKQQSSIPSKETWLDINDNVLENYTTTQRNIHNINSDDILNNSIRSNDIIWQWARAAGGPQNDWGWDVTMDNNGNSYFTGCFADIATFGPITLTSEGDYDIFVAKLNMNGAWQWAKSAGGIGFDWSRSIAVDTEGNSYITGHFTDNATFGNTVLTGQGYYNIFVAKLNANGAWTWAVSGGGSTSEGWAIGLDADKNPYVTGHFQGPVTFGNTNLTCEGGDDMFVAKLNTAGVWQWAIDSGGNSVDRGQGIAVQPNGNSYITGYFEGAVTFGNISLSSQGNKDVFISKVSPSGIWQWAKSGGGTGNDQGYSIAMNENTNLSICGDFDEDGAIFGNTTLTSHGRSDVFVANLNADGAWRWVTSGGGSSYDDGHGVAMDTDGNTYITGQYQIWIQFGNTTLSSQAGVELYCAKLDTNGTWQWAISACGTYQDSDWGYSIAVEANGIAYITGTFHASVTFGDITITSHGLMDAFIVKIYEIYGQSLYANFTWTPPNPRPGNIILFNGSLSYDPDGYITLYEWDWDNDNVYEESHSNPTAQYSWSTSGQYPVTLRVTDNASSMDTITKTVIVSTNQPPYTPSNPFPSNHATGVSIYTDLSWNGGDPDINDTVTYDIYFGTNSNPPILIHNQSATSYDPGTLNYNVVYYWKIKAWDNHGASTDGPVWCFETIFDLTPPITSIFLNGTIGNNSWFISPVTISLTSSDSESGVNYTMYKIDNDNWKIYTNPVEVYDDGDHIISYYSVDIMGNTETLKTVNFRIDTLIPITSHSISGTLGNNGWYISSVTITMYAMDNQSGINHTYYKLDGGVWIEYITSIILNSDGEHIFEYYSIDKAGNIEPVKGPFIIKIDQTLPSITLTKDKIGFNQVKFTANVSDETSGIDRVEFSLDGALQYSDTQSPYEWTWTGIGNHQVTATAYDMAGNLQSQSMSTPYELIQGMPSFKIQFIQQFLELGLLHLGYSQKE